MRFFIVEDDPSVVSNLEDIISTNNLGTVCVARQAMPLLT